MTERDLLWRVYGEYMASGEISFTSLKLVESKLKEPVSRADEWREEAMRLIEEMQSLQKKLDQIASK